MLTDGSRAAELWRLYEQCKREHVVRYLADDSRSTLSPGTRVTWQMNNKAIKVVLYRGDVDFLSHQESASVPGLDPFGRD